MQLNSFRRPLHPWNRNGYKLHWPVVTSETGRILARGQSVNQSVGHRSKKVIPPVLLQCQ